MKTVSAILGGALLATSVSAAVDPIVINGKHFFYKTNQTEFFVRGVGYQQDYTANETQAADASSISYTDPLANLANCQRDIPYLVGLRTNVIRTYAVDPTKDHSGCMNAFADAGIYIISDLSEPAQSIDRDSPAWTTDLLTRYTNVIDDLSQYSNTLGFFAGNEVSNSLNTTMASAFVKAAVRDSKQYIADNIDRPIYVGYATYDGDIRDQLAAYFNCGDQDAAIDFWGYNVYSWCGDSNYIESQYDERVAFFSDYSVPAFFAEYGCNTVDGEVIVRPFTEVQALYGDNMTGVFSGGIVYQYFESENQYGLITLDGDDVEPKQDYDNLSSQMKSASPSSVAYSAVSTGSPLDCPSINTAGGVSGSNTAYWDAVATPLPPTPRSDLCDCLGSTLSCVIEADAPAEGYGDIFGFICGIQGASYCDGIQANATTGNYGAYGMCEPQVQLNYVLNQYYVDQQASSNPSACAFTSATTQSAASATGSCSSLLQRAGTAGTNTLAAGTGSDTSGTDNAASSFASQSVGNGYIYFGLYVAGALFTGLGALAL